MGSAGDISTENGLLLYRTSVCAFGRRNEARQHSEASDRGAGSRSALRHSCDRLRLSVVLWAAGFSVGRSDLDPCLDPPGAIGGM